MVILFLAAWIWQLPAGFPLPHVQPQNRMSQERFELGRRLFYDVRLSWDGKQSCASCHQQARAFTDGRSTAPGSNGRNTMTLTNVAYNTSYMWSNTRLTTLEQQAHVPMSKEMGVRGHEREIVKRLRADYGRDVTMKTIVNALATFERALISGRSPYDRLVFDADHEALNESAWRGMRLFFSGRAGCSECHGGFNFSGPARYAGAKPAPPRLVSNGVTKGKFRVPTLRNVELTGPYMHDGSIATLDEVIGRYKPDLSPTERADLIAFLHSLTDKEFTTDARFANPWGAAASAAHAAEGRGAPSNQGFVGGALPRPNAPISSTDARFANPWGAAASAAHAAEGRGAPSN